MERWKQRLASVLAAVMLVSLLPAYALAEELPDDTLPASTEEVVGNPAEEPAEEPDGELAEGSAEEPMEELTEEPAETGEEQDSTVDVSNVELTEIGAWIGSDYIAAERGPEPNSLLPLEEKYFTLDLTGYLPEELKAVTLETVQTATPEYGDTGTIPENIAVWAKWGYYDENGDYIPENDDYVILGDASAIDLSSYSSYSRQITLELIVGTANQFDPDNVRYIVMVYTSGAGDLLEMSLADGNRSEIEVQSTGYGEIWRGSYYSNAYYLEVNQEDWDGSGEFYLGLRPAVEYEDLSVQVYAGCYENAEDLPEDQEITDSIWNADVQSSGYWASYGSLRDTPDLTVVWSRDGQIVSVMPVVVHVTAYQDYVNFYHLYSEDSVGDNYSDRVTDNWEYQYDDTQGLEWEVYTMRNGNPADGTYRLPATLEHNGQEVPLQDIGKYVQMAVVGKYDEVPQNAVDIKDELFGNGYVGTFNEGVVITVFDLSGEVLNYIAIRTQDVEEELPSAPTPLSADTYFRAEAAAEAENGVGRYDAYVMPYDDDSYYYNGYQTVFLLDNGSPVAEGTTIYPEFYAGSKVTVYAGEHSEIGGTVSGSEQTSRVSPHTFRNGQPIQYSAAAENGVNLKNYWVTFLTQQAEPTLFVNGVTNAAEDHRDDDGTPIREVILDSAHDYHHDIFIANLGAEAMTDLSITLTDAKNIQLDEYWTVNETQTLGAFETTYDATQYGGLNNVAKIRLLPLRDENGDVVSGEISGTLTITGGGETVTIKLTGRSGHFVISTDELMDGVKYVHYSSVIQTSNMYESDAVVFTMTEGTLPAGIVLKPNGELYGVPRVSSETPWHIVVRATYTDSDGQEYTDEKAFDLVIMENTDANVWNASDEQYELEQAIVNEDQTVSLPGGHVQDPALAGDNSWEAETQTFVSSGEYGNFVVTEVRLDSQRLTEGVDYTHEEGSTRITIRNQTLRSQGNGTHTISVEFREGDHTDGVLKRTAQNYTLTSLGTTSSGGGGGSSGGGSGSSGSGSASQPTTPDEPQESQATFTDVPVNHTFYEDVEWANENGLMQGVTAKLFYPRNAISQPTVVVVLARMAKVDLSQYENDGRYPTIPESEWYSNAAVWAAQAGLLPNNSVFNSEGSISRGDMAIMLVKYLASLGIDTTVPEPVTFADADLMTQEVNDAFQVLYHYGIFFGIGNLYMDPLGVTTRGQFAALIHRMDKVIEQYV